MIGQLFGELVLIAVVMVSCKVFDLDPTFVFMLWWVDDALRKERKKAKEKKDMAAKKQD